MKPVLKELAESGNYPQLANLAEGDVVKIDKADLKAINESLGRQGVKLSDDVESILVVRRGGILLIEVM